MTARGDVELTRVAPAERDLLRSHLSDYLREFAEMQGVTADLDTSGDPAYRWFQEYWSDNDRLPLFIRAKGAVVGFCLVRKIDPGWAVAEFSVLPDWRKRRVGLTAVALLAEMARASGVRYLLADVHAWNERARRFWERCGFEQLREEDGVLRTRRDLRSELAEP